MCAREGERESKTWSRAELVILEIICIVINWYHTNTPPNMDTLLYLKTEWVLILNGDCIVQFQNNDPNYHSREKTMNGSYVESLL